MMSEAQRRSHAAVPKAYGFATDMAETEISAAFMERRREFAGA